MRPLESISPTINNTAADDSLCSLLSQPSFLKGQATLFLVISTLNSYTTSLWAGCCPSCHPTPLKMFPTAHQWLSSYKLNGWTLSCFSFHGICHCHPLPSHTHLCFHRIYPPLPLYLHPFLLPPCKCGWVAPGLRRYHSSTPSPHSSWASHWLPDGPIDDSQTPLLGNPLALQTHASVHTAVPRLCKFHKAKTEITFLPKPLSA